MIQTSFLNFFYSSFLKMRESCRVSFRGFPYSLPHSNFELIFCNFCGMVTLYSRISLSTHTLREMPCLSGIFNVSYGANEKVPSMNPILVKCLGFFIACKLREVECLRSLLLGTCILLAFSHFSFISNTMLTTNTRRSNG